MGIHTPYEDGSVDILARNSTNWDDGRDSYKFLKESIKRNAIIQNEGTCFFCKRHINTSNNPGTLEHILDKKTYPIFTFRPNNLTYCCTICNSLKRNSNVLVNNNVLNNYDDYPNSSSDYLIIHPYFDDYYNYIKIDDIFYVSINDNDKALNTIITYHLNRLSLAEDKIKEQERENGKGLISNIATRALNNFSETVNDEISQEVDAFIEYSTYVTDYPARFIDKHLSCDKDNIKSRQAINMLTEENVNTFKIFRKVIEENRVCEYKTISQLSNKLMINHKNYREVIKDINIVLTSLSIIFRKKDRRTELSLITREEIIIMCRQFSGYRDKTHLNENIHFINQLKLLIDCSSAYNVVDFNNDLLVKVKEDKVALSSMNRYYNMDKRVN